LLPPNPRCHLWSRLKGAPSIVSGSNFTVKFKAGAKLMYVACYVGFTMLGLSAKVLTVLMDVGSCRIQPWVF
jgi:hypothetical protein